MAPSNLPHHPVTDHVIQMFKAKRAVISNASVWDTTKLLPEGALTSDEVTAKMSTPMTGSFVHLYLGE